MSPGRPERSFPRSCRLVASDEFRRTFRSRWRGRTGPFAWHARCNDLGHPRLGLAVPKRIAKRATARSRIKRLVRESFRLNRARLPSVDIVVSLRALPPDLYDSGVHRAVDGIWQDVMLSSPSTPCP